MFMFGSYSGFLAEYIRKFQIVVMIFTSSVSDPDPVGSGSGSVSGNVDMDPGSAKN